MSDHMYAHLIKNARTLFDDAPNGEVIIYRDVHPEYVRGVVELIIRTTGLSHDDDTQKVTHDLRYGVMGS